MDAIEGADLGEGDKDTGSNVSCSEQDEVDGRGMKRKDDLIMSGDVSKLSKYIEKEVGEDVPMVTKHTNKGVGEDKADKTEIRMRQFGSLRGKLTTDHGENKFIYKMNHKHRGYFIIINNKKFAVKTKMSTRNGTNIDARSLQKQFHELGFTVCRFDNQTCEQMRVLMKEAASLDHGDADCFACAILSHGNDNDVIYGTDYIMYLNELVTPFKGDECPTLAGKPKLFFIQACRGNRLDKGVQVIHEVDLGKMKKEQKIPVEADFLFAYSTVPGYYAWRHTKDGSWFVQSLCKALAKYGHLEIMHILTRTNYYVAYEYESHASDVYLDHKKQMSSIVSMLTKEFYFA